MTTTAKPTMCKRCGCQFPSITKMEAHRLQCRLVCDICQESFKGKGALATHIREAHAKNPHSCDICRMTFSKPHALAQHRAVAHEDKFPWKCEQCSGTFGRPDVLKRHVDTVHGDDEEFYNCYTCGTQVRRWDNWQRHIKNCQQ